MNFVDKNFYDIDNNNCVALPEDLNETKEVAIIDKNEQSLIRANIEDKILCNECQNEFEENNNNKKIKINYDNKRDLEPKEFGYFISSCSSEQSKIKAKSEKIKVIEINQNYSNIIISSNINNIPILIIYHKSKKKKKLKNI